MAFQIDTVLRPRIGHAKMLTYRREADMRYCASFNLGTLSICLVDADKVAESIRPEAQPDH